jgi:2-polyprenyl-3-methyl-5-hydroxy-6-metoxy-1,4-benzoquinol methylase
LLLGVASRGDRGRVPGAEAEPFPTPAPELVERARTAFRASFPIAEGCPLSPEEIDERIDSYYWHYPFQFGDRSVQSNWGPAAEGIEGMHYRRHMHLFPALLSQTGGSLTGKRVVDVGCNCGFWSLQARLAGADYVLGLEAGPANVEQGRFILELTGIDDVEFEVANAYDLGRERYGEFDVALYLGLLYHLAHPVLGLEKLAEVTREVALVGTMISDAKMPVCEVLPDRFHEQNFSNGVRMLPSPGAVALMLRHVGFKHVFRLPPQPDVPRSSRREHAVFIATK